MLVCICNRISDRDIRSAIHEGASGLSDVKAGLGVGSCCGQCIPFAEDLVNETVSQLQISKAFHLGTEIKA